MATGSTFLKRFHAMITKTAVKIVFNPLPKLQKLTYGTVPSTKIHGTAKFVKETRERREQILQKKFKNIIKESKWYTTAEWDSIKTEALNRHYINTEESFSGSVMRCLDTEEDLQTAKSLISYCKHTNTAPNVATWTFFLQLCAKFDRPDMEELILNAYKDLKKNEFAYNSDVINSCILALAQTKEWEKGIELMNGLKKNKERFWDRAYNAFMMTALKNRRFDFVWGQLLYSKFLSNEVVLKWIDLCREENNMWIGLKLVDYFGGIRATMPFDISDRIRKMFELGGYAGKYVNITPEYVVVVVP